MVDTLESHIKLKRKFYLSIHVVFLVSFMYAFYHFLRTPRVEMEIRRLWAYENWIIISFYTLFVYLILTDKEGTLKRREVFEKFRRILRVNLLLLLFPWGLFLLFAPHELAGLLGFGSFYWRILGGCSLLGFLLYFFPYRFYRHRASYYILVFGIVDNFLAASVVLYLFLSRQVPLAALSAVPLLYYFSFFFFEQVRRYRQIAQKQSSHA